MSTTNPSPSAAFAVLILVLSASSAKANTVSYERNDSTDVQALTANIDVSHRKTDGSACASITIEVVVKQVALDSPVFKGIGFYSNFEIQGSQSPFFPKGDFTVSGPATLKGGEAAAIVSFSGWGYCWQGDMTSSEMQQVLFKPYVNYEYTDSSNVDHQITNWENANNQVLGWQGPNDWSQVLSIDRKSQLLQ